MKRMATMEYIQQCVREGLRCGLQSRNLTVILEHMNCTRQCVTIAIFHKNQTAFSSTSLYDNHCHLVPVSSQSRKKHRKAKSPQRRALSRGLMSQV